VLCQHGNENSCSTCIICGDSLD